MWNYMLLALRLPPQLHGLAGVAETTENYPEALPAWTACSGGDSKRFMRLENCWGLSLSSVNLIIVLLQILSLLESLLLLLLLSAFSLFSMVLMLFLVFFFLPVSLLLLTFTFFFFF